MNRQEKKDLVRAIVEPYMKGRKDFTQLKAYHRTKPNSDGRIRTVQSPASTETGRLNSSESIIGDENSTNLQNLANTTALEDPLYAIRECFIAPEGYKLLAVDYDKAEAICQAAYAKDWSYYDRLLRGEDVHSWHAGHFFQNQAWIDGAKANKTEYQVSKNATYASLYDASPRTLQNTVNRKADQIGRKVTLDEIEGFVKIIMGLHPIKQWHAAVREKAASDGNRLTNAFGFTRVFFNPDFHRRSKEQYAFLPQSTVASNISRSLMEIDETLDSEGELEVVLQVHDELLFYVLEDLVEESYLSIKKIMEQPFTIHGREVYIPASGKVGERWGKMNEIS